MTGERILHYQVVNRLGAGGMGEVYLAQDTRLGRQVALKFLPASYQYDPERRDRFFREARAASSLSSPNIAAIYDIGEHDGTCFIVMEYVEGDTLTKRISTGPLPFPEVLDIAGQVADALDEARLKGVVHRDIKSSNLMLTGRGLVKVLDFGLARILQECRCEDPDRTLPIGQETSPGIVLGTVSYMSPEQALGRTTDHRSDIFSLGVVTYEMLTGRLPFDGESATEIIDRILHSDPPAIARLNYSVPLELERIVRKTLEKDAEFRYQTSRELYIDLRNLRRDLNGSERSRSSQSLSPEMPTQLLPAMAVAAAVPVAVPAPANAVAVMTFRNITGERSDDWIGSGIAETVTGDLKNVGGLSVIGRERIIELLKNLGTGELEGDDKFAMDIGRRLGAAWTITGGYQRIGDQIRITARFVEVGTGAIIKTVKIDGTISDIFGLQDRIVYELSQGLNLQLANDEVTEIERKETQSVEAYENFSRGLINLRMGSADSLDRAIYLFQKAVEHDSNYAIAWAALGLAYDLKASFLSIPDLAYQAIECERKAININPKLSHAHQGLGAALSTIGHFDEAIVSLKEAVKLDPGNAGAHATLGRAYWSGKGMFDEGITELEHAIKVNPEAGWAYLQLALLYTLRGNYDRAESICLKAIDMQEQYLSGREGMQIIGAHTRLGYVYYCQGRYDDAILEYDKEMEFLGASDHGLRDRGLIELNQKIGAAYLKKGAPVEAGKYFKRAIKGFEERLAKGADDPSTKYYIACLYSLRGDTDRAMKYFEATLTDLRALNIARAKIDPDLEAIRSHPRFREIIGE